MPNSGLCRSGAPQSKETKKREKYIDHARG